MQRIEKRKKNSKRRGCNLNTLILENDAQEPIDIYQKLSNNRILFLSGLIDDHISSDIVANLLLKDSEDPNSKITIFINSEGGDIRNALMIYDMINIIQSPVETVCIGSAMDEAAIILAAGDVGMRYATKHAAIAVGHLVNNWVAFSDLTNAKKNLDQVIDDNKRMIDVLAKCSGKTNKQVMVDFERKVFMNANQAVKYGLIDKVVKFNK